jgi:hypothetical protein
VEHHLSIFRPYDRDAKHEDQLTRAALIILKLVPLAHEAFLGLCGCGRLSELPRPRFDMQTETLLPLGAEAGGFEVAEFVSVFLGPHEDEFTDQQPNLASERRARYDGVIQYESRLLVVIESKLYSSASQQQALDINTKGLSADKDRFVFVRWQELLDSWWNLTELGTLGPAELAVMTDFFDNAEENFGDLLPYSDLERCGDHPKRRVRRLRAILEEATGLPAEVRDVNGHAGVKFPGRQVVAFDRVSLYVDGDNVVVSTWPAELTPQYTSVYGEPARAEALIALAQDPAWQVRSNFHLSFWRASSPRRWYPARHLSGEAYVEQWIQDFKNHRAGRKPVEEATDESFRNWLVNRNYSSREELADLDEWIGKLRMDKFDVRPGIHVTRSWTISDAIARDADGKLADDVRDAINQVLEALDEPRLERLQP